MNYWDRSASSLTGLQQNPGKKKKKMTFWKEVKEKVDGDEKDKHEEKTEQREKEKQLLNANSEERERMCWFSVLQCKQPAGNGNRCWNAALSLALVLLFCPLFNPAFRFLSLVGNKLPLRSIVDLYYTKTWATKTVKLKPPFCSGKTDWLRPWGLVSTERWEIHRADVDTFVPTE